LWRGISVEFDGRDVWQATLHGGPVVALNVMAVRGRCHARIGPLRDATPISGECVALVRTMNGRCQIHAADSDYDVMLTEGHAIRRLPRTPAFHLAPQSLASDASIALVIVEHDGRR